MRLLVAFILLAGCGSSPPPHANASSPALLPESHVPVPTGTRTVLWTPENGPSGSATWTPEPGTTLTVHALPDQRLPPSGIHGHMVPLELQGTAGQPLDGCEVDMTDGNQVEVEVQGSTLVVHCMQGPQEHETHNYTWQSGHAVPSH